MSQVMYANAMVSLIGRLLLTFRLCLAKPFISYPVLSAPLNLASRVPLLIRQPGYHAAQERTCHQELPRALGFASFRLAPVVVESVLPRK